MTSTMPLFRKKTYFLGNWHSRYRDTARLPQPGSQATQSRTRSRTTARTKGRFMESSLSLRACIGTMNLSNAVGARLCEPQRVATAPSPAGHRPALRDGRFMERSLSLRACSGTMNLTRRWERGSVSRSASLQPQVLRVTDPRSETAGSWKVSFRFWACIGTLNRSRLVAADVSRP